MFLPDGTLLMTSCTETYRLARWQPLDAERVAWDEDGARIEAAIAQPAADRLELRLQLAGEAMEGRAQQCCPRAAEAARFFGG